MKKAIITIVALISFAIGWFTHTSIESNKLDVLSTKSDHSATADPKQIASALTEQKTTPLQLSKSKVIQSEKLQSLQTTSQSINHEQAIRIDDIYEASEIILIQGQTSESLEYQEALSHSVYKLQEKQEFGILNIAYNQCDSKHCLVSIEGVEQLNSEHVQKLKQAVLFGDIANALPGKGGTYYIHEQNGIKSLRVLYDTSL